MALYNYFEDNAIDVIQVNYDYRKNDNFEKEIIIFFKSLNYDIDFECDGKILTIFKKSKVVTYKSISDKITNNSIHLDHKKHFERLITFLSKTPTVFVEVKQLIDNQICALDLLKIDEFVKDFGFKLIGNNSKYLKVSVHDEEIKFVEEHDVDFNRVWSFDRLRKHILDNDTYLNSIFIRHESLHTTSIYLDSIYEHFVNHHYYHQNINPKFNSLIDEVLSKLSEAYQVIDDDYEQKKYIKNILL